jgi:hypothetical protein
MYELFFKRGLSVENVYNALTLGVEEAAWKPDYIVNDKAGCINEAQMGRLVRCENWKGIELGKSNFVNVSSGPSFCEMDSEDVTNSFKGKSKLFEEVFDNGRFVMYKIIK